MTTPNEVHDLGNDMELIHHGDHWIINDHAGISPKDPMVLTDKQFKALIEAGQVSL